MKEFVKELHKVKDIVEEHLILFESEKEKHNCEFADRFIEKHSFLTLLKILNSVNL